ncbi:MAG: trehalose-phosphatase [Dehalococcoidia bacterium]|nr:trehalose-phosphatase [Dehalococcoidia bacterium]
MADRRGEDRAGGAAAVTSAFEGLEAMLSRARGRRVAVFLDYDGTLTPIVAQPDLAVLSPNMRQVVERLAGVAQVALVSGRDIEDLHRMAAIDGIAYAGSHGFQFRDRDGHEEVMEGAAAYRADLERAAAAVERELAGIPGTLIERKGFAVATHYRQVAPEREHEVCEQVETVAARFPRLRVTGGKKVIELRPALDWDKGRAVLALVERWGGDEVYPVYLGDDETDEDAFRALRGRGAGIIVGDASATLAQYRLRDVDEVHAWLEALRGRLADRPL